jgi:hypothetical protein
LEFGEAETESVGESTVGWKNYLEKELNHLHSNPFQFLAKHKVKHMLGEIPHRRAKNKY